MTIDSNKVTITASLQDIFDFMKDSNNLIHLLPKENISDFKSSVEECSFKVQGGIIISLVQNGNDGLDKIFLKSGEKSPFPFTLTIFNSQIEENKVEGYIHFDGKVNMFLKMMVEKPLINLFNYMSDKLKDKFKD